MKPNIIKEIIYMALTFWYRVLEKIIKLNINKINIFLIN